MKIKLIKPKYWEIEGDNGRMNLTPEEYNNLEKLGWDKMMDEIKNKVGKTYSSRIVWDTPSGDIEVGDCYYAPWMHEGVCSWENCTATQGHLIIKMPDGGYWDTDSRASNCTMKEDRLHRCWVKHGDIDNMTVDKDGLTCGAGAGSIQMNSWHGFLKNGELVQ